MTEEELAFFESIVDASLEIQKRHSDVAGRLWRKIHDSYPRVGLPMVFVTHRQTIQFTWRTKVGVASVDVNAKGECEWFARLRSEDHHYEHETHIGENVPHGFFVFVSMITSDNIKECRSHE